MTRTGRGQTPDPADMADLSHQGWVLMSAWTHWQRASSLLRAGDVDGAGDMLAEVRSWLDAVERDHTEAVRVLLRLKDFQASGIASERDRGWLETKMEFLFGIDGRDTFELLNGNTEFSDRTL